jgi:hypothetical protein
LPILLNIYCISMEIGLWDHESNKEIARTFYQLGFVEKPEALTLTEKKQMVASISEQALSAQKKVNRIFDTPKAVKSAIKGSLLPQSLVKADSRFIVSEKHTVSILFDEEAVDRPNGYTLPDNLRGRSIHAKVIPTVCNLENMLQKLVQVNGDFAQLKQWEKRSYKAYRIEEIQNRIMTSPQYAWKDIVREHILSKRPSDFGASVIDIYLVAYVAETNGAGKDEFFKYVKNAGISDNGNSAQAIWQVGKGDGVYLEILHDNGQVKDWNFIIKWVEGK